MAEISECNIFIIDDDEAVRRGISFLLVCRGYVVQTFSNGKNFLESDDIKGPGCILLDIFLDDDSGLDLQDVITKKFRNMPVIFITGYGDIPMSVQAIKKGATNFLQKPVDDKLLFKAVEEAINDSIERIRIQEEKLALRTLIDTLTPREFEIFRFVTKGMLNKQIASELNITEHTVKLHRGKITEKLGVKSATEMVYLAVKLNIR
jgi:FixJ family two-component response regulator